jgi:hypothetical protein
MRHSLSITRLSCLAGVAGAFLLLAAGAARAASPEDLLLQPRYKPGDTYNLELRVTTRTEASSKGENGEHFQEDVKLDYRASVLVVDVDENGRPTKERHRRVSLTFERPGDMGSLFKEGAAFDVERRDRVRLSLGGKPVDPKLERTVAEILEKQPEYTLEPAMLDPGRPVSVGESWELSPTLTRRFLQGRGIRTIEFGEPATATLQQRARENGTLERFIAYDIPIERFELTQMPPNTEASRSEASLHGEVSLADAPRSGIGSSVSELRMSLSGISTGVARRLPWSLRSTVVVEKKSPDGQQVALSERPAR